MVLLYNNIPTPASGTHTGGKASSTTHGYSKNPSKLYLKFPFSSESTISLVGSVVDTPSADDFNFFGGVSSSTDGYWIGGRNGPAAIYSSSILKFPFSSDTNTSDVAEITRGAYLAAGSSGSTHGYASGGYSPTTSYSDVIDKFPFSSDTPSTDIGELNIGGSASASYCSTAEGYIAGGNNPGAPTRPTSAEKFPFASDTSASLLPATLSTSPGDSGFQV